MDEHAFLTLMILINHRIPHVLVEIYGCRFLAKIEGQSYPLIQGAKTRTITGHHAGITWIGGSTTVAKPTYWPSHQPKTSGPTCQ